MDQRTLTQRAQGLERQTLPHGRSCGCCRPQATFPSPGPWAATPELRLEQSLAKVLALMEAVSLQVRPLQMPHPQKFRQQALAGRLLTEIVHILPGQTNAFICCSRELPRALVSAWSG